MAKWGATLEIIVEANTKEQAEEFIDDAVGLIHKNTHATISQLDGPDEIYVEPTEG
jgi:hypothetical protein